MNLHYICSGMDLIAAVNKKDYKLFGAFFKENFLVFCITDLMALLFGNFLSGRFLERICKRNGSGESDL